MFIAWCSGCSLSIILKQKNSVRSIGQSILSFLLQSYPLIMDSDLLQQEFHQSQNRRLYSFRQGRVPVCNPYRRDRKCLTDDITLLGNDVVIPAGTYIPQGAVVNAETLHLFTKEA